MVEILITCKRKACPQQCSHCHSMYTPPINKAQDWDLAPPYLSIPRARWPWRSQLPFTTEKEQCLWLFFFATVNKWETLWKAFQYWEKRERRGSYSANKWTPQEQRSGRQRIRTQWKPSVKEKIEEPALCWVVRQIPTMLKVLNSFFRAINTLVLFSSDYLFACF